jgi:ketopantoate reductase
MQLQKWEKLVMNVAFSSFTALSELDTHAWLKSSDEAMSVTRRVMREIMAVAEKSGMRVREGYVEELLDQVRMILLGSQFVLCLVKIAMIRHRGEQRSKNGI